MIIITGAAGFIGSCIASYLNQKGFLDLVLVDDFHKKDKQSNYIAKTYSQLVDRQQFWSWIKGKEHLVQFIIHLGARTDTTETEAQIFEKLNLDYSKKIWHLCTQQQIPLIYASSAATYGAGEYGFDDQPHLVNNLSPLNPYGRSKNDFDRWVLSQKDTPFFWVGLKFFNVYGPNEYHKGRMASVIFHAYHQILQTSQMQLFQSHRPDFANGEQKRDFIYVKDICSVIYFFMTHRKDSGLYNLGTGTARTFNDLVTNVFEAMKVAHKIVYIPTPKDIRDTYQYFTEAKMERLLQIGYNIPFHTLEEGIKDYVQNYLMEIKYY